MKPIVIQSHTTTHHLAIYLVEIWYEPCFVRFAKYFPFDSNAHFSDASSISVSQLYLKISIQAHYITIQDIICNHILKQYLWNVLYDQL